MVLNRGKFNQDFCAAGEAKFQQLDPAQFKPPSYMVIDSTADCPKCEQRTKVKKDGFFVRHKSSKAGYRGAGDFRAGEPPRERGRRQ